MPTLEQQEAQREYQKTYIKTIEKKAIVQAMENSDALLFDPQGFVLIDISLSKEEQNLYKKAFEKEPPPVITVRLNISNIPELKKPYQQEIQSRHQEMQRRHQEEQRGYQRAYIEKIKNKAIVLACDLAETNPDALLFDPQGRVLIDVPLSEENNSSDLFGETMTQAALFEKGWRRIPEKSELENQPIYKREPTPITTVSLDVSGIDVLKNLYKQQYTLPDELSEYKGSIIALQHEFHFHLALAARTYHKVFREQFSKEDMEQAHQEAMKRLHQKIKETFNQSNKTGSVNLIKELDKARKKLFAEAHSILMEEIVKKTGHHLTKKDLDSHKKQIRLTAQKTTATDNDLLHTDDSLGHITWISGSKITSHDRKISPSGRLLTKDNLKVKMEDIVADRQILTFSLNSELQDKPRLRIRIPSLDVKEGLAPDHMVEDVSEKFKILKKKYSLNEMSTLSSRKAFTYNLYTTINERLDNKGNKQSQGARIILRAVHEYNVVQKLHEKENAIYCFVQNIPVNGFGDSLGYGGNDLKTEATLMAEMAMLYNISDNHSCEPFSQYDSFLSYDNRRNFFSDSIWGKEAIGSIKAIKDQWKQPHNEGINDDPLTKAKNALKRMMAYDLHHQHEYSKLVQSLSVFIEEISLGSCKSGNERTQAINGRVAVLDSQARNSNSTIFQHIDDLARAKPDAVLAQANCLKHALDTEYDKHLQSAAAMISWVDQGAASKLMTRIKTDFQIFKNFFEMLMHKLNPNPNYAEETTLIHLSQKNAKIMQAHNGLTQGMYGAWTGETKSFTQHLGTVGIFLSIITFPIGLILARIDYDLQNRKMGKDVQERIEKARQKHAEQAVPACNVSIKPLSSIECPEIKLPDEGVSHTVAEKRPCPVIDIEEESNYTPRSFP